MQKTTTHTCNVPRERAELEAHWRRFGVHRASRQADLPAAATGWPHLDRQLPGGGYPLGAVTELLVSHRGVGELSLLLPALAARLKAQPARHLAFVSPPQPLNAPALLAAGIDCARVPIVDCRDDSERVWCVEQMARAQAFCGFVLWSDTLDDRALRRLQLAAERAACPVFVYRPIQRAGQRSPAALRLAVTGKRAGQTLEVLKCRGPAGARLNGLTAARDSAWQMPSSTRRDGQTTAQRADNDAPPAPHRPSLSDTSHVARAAFSPLGAR